MLFTPTTHTYFFFHRRGIGERFFRNIWILVLCCISQEKFVKKFTIFYFFLRVKKDRFLGSSPLLLSPCPAGSVWARPEPEPEAPASATELMAPTHWLISSSSEAWKRHSPPLVSLKGDKIRFVTLKKSCPMTHI